MLPEQNKPSLIEQDSHFTFSVSEDWVGSRADRYIAHCFPDYSRSFLQDIFKQQLISLERGKIIKAAFTLRAHDTIHIHFAKKVEPEAPKALPSNLSIKIVAEEQDFFIIEKPAGLVVHPPTKAYEWATLTDWIVQSHEDLAHVGAIDRPGIVHRLDKDTSGLMIIPRTNAAHGAISQMFKDRLIKKTYLAIVQGHPEQKGSIDFYIGRHHADRRKMNSFTRLTKQPSSRDALTHYEVINYFEEFSLVAAKPVTGRTHQIRVHFGAIGHSILGDPMYGKESKLIKRHALHAHELAFEYNGTSYHYQSALPDDIRILLEKAKPLKTDNE